MGDINSPQGDMGDLYKTGFGGHTSFNYMINNSWEIGATIGNSKWDADDNYWSEMVSKVAGRTVTISADIPFSQVELMVDLYNYLYRGQFSTYLLLSLGTHFAKMESNSITIDGTQYNIGKSESKSIGGYKLGVGALYEITSAMALKVMIAYAGNGVEFKQSTTTSEDGFSSTSSSSSTALYLNISLGFSYAL